jgi:hypothetical protein
MEKNECLQGRVILVETAENKWRCEDNPDIRKEIDDVVVCTYAEIKAGEAQFVGGVSDNKGAVRGNVYVYDEDIDRFVLNNRNVDIVIYEYKANCFINFVRLLGAVSCDYDIHIAEEDLRSLENRTKARVKTVNADVGVNIKSKDEIKQRMSLNCKMKGMVLTDEDYEKAEDLFNMTPMLRNNKTCETILKGRNPEENEFEEFNVTFELSASLQSSINTAAKISAIKLFKVENELTMKREVNKSVYISFKVKF